MATENLGGLIRRLRTERGLTQGQLATYAQVSRPWLARVESGEIRRPERERLERLAVLLHVPSEILLATAGYRVGPQPLPPPRRAEDLARELQAAIEREREEAPILVPETSQPASAGAGVVVEAEYWPYMPAADEREHRFIAVPVSGDCMEPEIRSGHRVIVDLDASPRPGDIVLAVHDGESLVKILEERDGQMYLVALREQPPIRVDEQTRVLGVVKPLVGGSSPSTPAHRHQDMALRRFGGPYLVFARLLC
jgi:transcriptional regulator with XRE-family HTH domain